MLLKTRIKTNQWLTSFVEVLTEVWTSHPSKVRGQEPCLTQYLRSSVGHFLQFQGCFVCLEAYPYLKEPRHLQVLTEIPYYTISSPLNFDNEKRKPLENDRAEKRLRMLQISISKSFDRPFLAPCKVDFSVDFGVVSLEKMELGTRFKGVFCGEDFFRHAGNLSIYCLAVLQCKTRGNPANSWDHRLQRYGEWVNSEWVLRLNLALHFKLYLTKLLCKTHRVRIILDNNFRYV